MTAHQAGDHVTATLDDTTGQQVTAELTITRADQLGCGCHRLTATRPGPDTGTCRTVQLLTGCQHHDRQIDP
ncbi:hypothetical protein [Micromonospora cathayae]|uniref:Uncharacterized protein n=1 Tax=Micromonospora cathayae TaxID=3028804 RepID=A0ABY7ZVW1_9ACTN|nr:hypothetical protein [Micromonospora sp. HUAS 3]WDZ87202.1 hypothetical protein PVK37_12740 [Micromonospora sp. HUAS 3]